ncbi:hypothetical protein Tcan_00656, partial [Toxocara canis]
MHFTANSANTLHNAAAVILPLASFHSITPRGLIELKYPQELDCSQPFSPLSIFLAIRRNIYRAPGDHLVRSWVAAHNECFIGTDFLNIFKEQPKILDGLPLQTAQ